MTSVVIAAPVRPSARSGNDVTARRWAALLRSGGCRASVVPVDEHADEPSPAVVAALAAADLLIAVHARRSAAVVEWWRRHRGGSPLVVALSGTDLYGDLPGDPRALRAVETADALVVLQEAAVRRVGEIVPGAGERTVVIHQSVDPADVPVRRTVTGELRVVVLAHLRKVKAPLLAARAAGRLPATSTVTVHHAGRAHDESWAAAAAAEMRRNRRYHWHGELDRAGAMALLGSGHVLACTSVEEGGANVVSEAIAAGVPVIGTRIDGNTGLLGDDHPGFVAVGDEAALAELLGRLEREPLLLDELGRRSGELGPLTDPTLERDRLADLIRSLS